MNNLLLAPPIREIELKPLPEWLVLREVQAKMFENLAKSYRSGKRKPIVVAATASGKTYWAAVLFHKILTKKPKSKLIFIVPRNTLVKQAYDDFQEILDIPISIIQGQDERIDLSLPIQIATIQTLGNRIKKYPELFNNYDAVICDESHLRFKAMEDIEAKWVIGLTATAYSKGLGLYYDDLVKSIPAKELTEQGIIAPIKVLSAQRQIKTSMLSTTSTGEYNDQEEEDETIKIVGDVLREWEDNDDMRGRPFIGFAKTISACIALSDTFVEAGHKVSYVHSKMSDSDCEAVLETFKDGGLDGVFSVVKLIEGFSYPEASALLLCTAFAPKKGDPGTPNALNRYVQCFGRVRRSVKNDPEKYALVHDHSESYIKYGHPDAFELGFNELCTEKPPKTSGVKTEKDLKPKVCPSCGYYIERGRECPECGYIMEKHTEIVEGKVVEFVNGVMVLQEDTEKKPKKNKKRELTKEEKIEVYGGLKQYCFDKGYKIGWAANKFKEMTGVWPNSYKNAPLRPPNKRVLNYIKMGNIAYAARQKKAETMEK